MKCVKLFIHSGRTYCQYLVIGEGKGIPLQGGQALRVPGG